MSQAASPTPYVDLPEEVRLLQEEFLAQHRAEERARILLELGRLGGRREGGVFPYRDAVGRTLVELFNLSVWWPEKRALLRAMGECRFSVVIFRYLLRMLDTIDMQDGEDGVEMITAIIDAFGRIGLAAIGPILLRRYVAADVPESIRLQSLEVLGHLGFREAEPFLLQALQSPGEARITGIYGLSELVSKAGVADIDQILSETWQRGELEWHHDRKLVHAAVTYLCTLGVAQSQPWVRRLLYTHEPDLRSLALWGRYIWQLNHRGDVLDLLTAALDEEDDYVRASLGRGLRAHDIQEVLDSGEALCEGVEGLVRLLQVVAEVGGPEVEAWMWARYIRPAGVDPQVRRAAIRGLRHVDAAQARALLALATSGAPEEVAVAAVRTAANFGPLACLEDLLALLDHEEATLRQEGLRGVQHLLLAWRPRHVTLKANKGQAEGHRPEHLPVDDATLEKLDAAFRKILKRDDDGMTQGLAAYAAANLRRDELWPRVLRLAEKSPSEFARMASYHALLDLPNTDQVERMMAAFAQERSRLVRSACIRTLAPLLASLERPDAAREQALLQAIDEAVGDANQYELAIYAYALGQLRAVDPLPVLDRIAAVGGHRSRLEVIGALGRLRRLGIEPILERIDRVMEQQDPDSCVRAVGALAGLQQREAFDRLLDLLQPTAHAQVRAYAIRELALLGRSRRGLTLSGDRLDGALERIDHLLRAEKGGSAATSLQEDLMDLKLAIWRANRGGGVDDERVDRSIREQLGDDLNALLRYGEPAEEVLRALRGAEFFHLQSREMPPSADLSPAILSYTKGIELWLDLRLKDLLPTLRDMARDQYQTIMDRWDDYERLCRGLVSLPVEDANRAVDWSKVPRVAKAMKEKKFTADWRTLSISNSGAIVIFYGVEMPTFGAYNTLGLRGEPEAILSVAVNSLTLAALRNAMAHEQSASRQDLAACRDLAYEVMRGIASWG